MDAYSSLLRKGVSKASFSVSPTGVQNSIRGSFSFNPDSSHAGNRYIVVFRCSDQYFTNDQAVTINVTSGIGLEDLGAAERFGNWQLYPNPARDFINLSFVSEDQEKLNIEILDLEGRVLNALEADAHAGVNLLQLDQPDLQSGIYLVQVKAEDGLLWTTKMIKQ
jgi:hypothetical protein